MKESEKEQIRDGLSEVAFLTDFLLSSIHNITRSEKYSCEDYVCRHMQDKIKSIEEML